MDVLKTIKPGQPGSKRLQHRFGDKLLAVRYRLDKTKNTRLTTVELVVDEYPNLDSGTITVPIGVEQARYLAIKVAFNEPAVRKKIKHAVVTGLRSNGSVS